MEIITEKRVGRRIMQHIRAIAIPRFAGTSGERIAQTYIRNTFQNIGYVVNEHDFTTSLFPLEVFPRLAIAVICTLIVIAYTSLRSLPVLSFELCFLTLLLIVISSRWNGLFERMYKIKSFGKLQSKNIIAIHSHQQNHLNVIFTAHYDSKSQTFSAVVRFIQLLSLVFFITLSIVSLSLVIVFGLSEIIPIAFIIPMCVIGLLLQCNSTHNRSAGAYDNASGVGVMLELAHTYAHENPGVNLAFVATGAEEAGLCGAVALMHDGRFIEHFSPSRTIIVNLDGMGSDGAVYITDRYGIPPIATGRLLSDLCRKIGMRFGIDTKRHWLPTGAAMDHIPFSYHGYQTVTLSTANFNKTFRAMHTNHDVIENLSVTSLENCFAIAQEIIDSIPTTRYLASAN